MTVAGRLPVLKSCICWTRYERSRAARLGMPGWLTPFVPWQLAQAAARLRPATDSESCAVAGETSPMARAKATGGGGRIMGSRNGPAARRSGFRGGFGDFFFRKFQRDLAAVVDVHSDLAAVGELAEEQLVGEGAADRVLDEARHGTRPHERIEAALGEVFAQGVGEYRLDLLLLKLRLQLHQELVPHAQDDVLVERAERNRRVQPVPEFGREHALDFHAFVPG